MKPKELTTPLVVPEFGNGIVKLYKADPASGNTIADGAYTIDVQNVLNKLFPGQGRIARPNSCLIYGYDLFVSNSSGNSQGILKFPNYVNAPATAVASAFIFTLDGNDYVGMAVDDKDNLYATEGGFANNKVIKYGGASVGYPGSTKANQNNYASKADMGNAGIISYFGNLVFDFKGNLWVTDYLNHRVVAFTNTAAADANDYHILGNRTDVNNIPVSTTAPLDSNTSHLFTSPEGIDFDANGILFIANNNDGPNGDSVGHIQNNLTSVVKFSTSVLASVLATPQQGTFTPLTADSNVTYFIYQLKNSASGRPQLGGLQVDKTSRRIFINEEVSGKGRWYDIVNIPSVTTLNELAITSTNPGNGGISLVDSLVLYMQDDSGDAGLEPDGLLSGIPYESTDISITATQKSGPLSSLPATEPVAGGASAWVYVRIRNKGRFASKGAGTETVQLYWAKAGMGLAWPKPWRGGVVEPSTLSSMGGQIGTAQNIGIVEPGKFIIVEFNWTSLPDPSKYLLQDGHFCLLARVETSSASPFGMTYTEEVGTTQTALVDNVINNNKIVWQNIHIDPKTNNMIAGSIIASNYSDAVMNTRISFEILDEEARPMPLGKGELLITSKGNPLEKLNSTRLDPQLIERLDNGWFKVLEPKNGITNLVLQPGEIFPLSIQYVPAIKMGGFVLRAFQMIQDGDAKKIVGGQTFVYGKVKGYNIAAGKRNDKVCCDIPNWLWILLVIFSLTIITLFVQKQKK